MLDRLDRREGFQMTPQGAICGACGEPLDSVSWYSCDPGEPSAVCP